MGLYCRHTDPKAARDVSFSPASLRARAPGIREEGDFRDQLRKELKR